jgi:hypothetical protein
VGVREGFEEGGRNDPNIVCTYELKKKENIGDKFSTLPPYSYHGQYTASRTSGHGMKQDTDFKFNAFSMYKMPQCFPIWSWSKAKHPVWVGSLFREHL